MRDSDDTMVAERAETAPNDEGHRGTTIGDVVMLGVGGVLIVVATLTTLLALRAEWQTADAKADTRAAESDLSDSHADTADLVSQQADLQTAAAEQSALRAQVVESWNAVASSNDAALSAATLAVALFNDGAVERARQVLDTEASGALETAEQNLETLQGNAQGLRDAVEELRRLLADAEQP